MARPNKSGLDYFPLDVDVDDKIELVEAQHDIVGFGIIIKLYQMVYKNGYYVNATEERLLLLKKKVNVDINSVNEIITDCLKWKLFDQTLYNKYKVLTSCGVQKKIYRSNKET